MKQSQQLQMKVILKCLENVQIQEQDQQEKDRLVLLLKTAQNKRDKKELLKSLNPVQLKMHMLLTDGFTAFKQSFHELLKLEKYRNIGETEFDITDYLLNLQPNLKIAKEMLTIDNLVSKYTVNNLKLKKQHDSWNKEIFGDWAARSKEKMKKLEVKRAELTTRTVFKQSQEKQSDSDQNESEEVVQRPAPPPIRPQPQRRQVPEKPRRDPIRPEVKIENTRELKSRAYAMEKYLENRKDMHWDKNKLKEISEFLAAKFDNFMKRSIERILDTASLKNRKNPKLGNELGYFAAENDRVSAQSPFYISPNSKVCVLLYKHKLQLYTNLRAKQLKREEELRAALEQRTSDSEKKVDKKIENYVLKPRPKQVQLVEIFREERDAMRTTPNAVLICAEHVLHFLQNHHFLKDSLLLFNAYHY